jgi:hypothetical protein
MKLMYRKLSDAQVKTLMTIVAYSPDAPSDLDRYPNLRMMLDAEIIQLCGRRLEFNSHCDENAYQYVVPVTFVDDCLGLGGFDDMEKAGRLMFRATADHDETDTFYYWDVLQLCAELNKYGCTTDIPGGRIELAQGTSEETGKLIEELINTFQAKYPSARKDGEEISAGEKSCPGDCEPVCAWCNNQADIAACHRN